MTQCGNTWTESIQGGLEIGGALATPFRRPRRLRWGTTDDELERSYPGDGLVPEPKWSATHAISIDATPRRIWPWIAQIGQGRGGFYAYEKLENLVGSRIRNATRILEQHQDIHEGDAIKLHEDTPPMTVAMVERPTTLVLYGNPVEGDSGATLATSWAFLLLGEADDTTRLISRTRYDHADDRRSGLLGGPLVLEPVSFVMERKMLKVIKALAEASG